jgi:hypothetical protein
VGLGSFFLNRKQPKFYSASREFQFGWRQEHKAKLLSIFQNDGSQNRASAHLEANFVRLQGSLERKDVLSGVTSDTHYITNTLIDAFVFTYVFIALCSYSYLPRLNFFMYYNFYIALMRDWALHGSLRVINNNYNHNYVEISSQSGA